jgi:2-polyprenyl-3-methyl-5-hydroxy-6-metoxy-1,4-benzoquinol methylase
MREPYDPQTYWERRLSGKLDITTVGHAGLGYTYNQWLYRARFRALGRVLKKLSLEMNQAAVTEVGVGSGAYLPFWLARGAHPITGIDITSASVSRLSERYPNLRFLQADICAPEAPPAPPADVVTAFDVLFHITDDAAFEGAITNLGALAKPGGLVFLSDGFCPQSWGPAYHEYHRSYNLYAEALRRHGMEPILLAPIFFTMTTTLCDSTVAARRLVPVTAAILRFVQRRAASRRTAWVNQIVGGGLCAVDGILGLVSSTGPTLKLMIARKN